MGSVTFYIKKEDGNIERQLKDMEPGELSAFITECIKRNSREYLEEKREQLNHEIKLLDNILKAHTDKDVAFTKKAIEEKEQVEVLINSIIEEQLQAQEQRTPNKFNLWIERKTKNLGINYNDITDRYRVAWEKKEQERKAKIELEAQERKEHREREKAKEKDLGTTEGGA